MAKPVVDPGIRLAPVIAAALFYDLSSEKTVSISGQSERRERDLQEPFRKAKRSVAFFVDDAHDLHPKTLTAPMRLVELVTEGGGQLAVILVGHPKLRNDLKQPLMEEIGDRTTVFEFGGLRDRQRDYIDWALRTALASGIEPDAVLTEDSAILLAAKLKTPLQIWASTFMSVRACWLIGRDHQERQPLAQRRLADPQIRCDTVAWQPAGQRYAHRLPLKLFCMLDHLFGLLLRALIAQVTDAKPLKIQLDSGTAVRPTARSGTSSIREMRIYKFYPVLAETDRTAIAGLTYRSSAKKVRRSGKISGDLDANPWLLSGGLKKISERGINLRRS